MKNELPEKGDYIIFKDNSWPFSPTKEGLVIDFVGSCGNIKVKDGTYSPGWYNLNKITICHKRKATIKDYLNQYDLVMIVIVIGLFTVIVCVGWIVLLKALL